MSNKLKKLFLEEGEKYTETITFNDIDSFKEFGKALEDVYSTGKEHMVSGIKSIQSNLTDGEHKYPIDNGHPVDMMVIGPCKEFVKWPIQVDGQPEYIEFYRKRLKNCIEVTSVQKEVVEILILLHFNEQKTEFKYNLYPERAKNLSAIILEYKKTKALIIDLFKNNTDIPEYQEMITFLSKSIRYFQRLHDLEVILNINISPTKMKIENDNEFLIEKLYLMLVKGEKIRSNDRLNFIKADMFDGELGQEIMTAYIDKIEYELFGEKITVFLVNSIFNAIISKIEDNKNEGKKIYFSDTDTKPMYRVYSGFLSEEEAIHEQYNIRFNIQEYKDAKKLDEYLEILSTEK